MPPPRVAVELTSSCVSAVAVSPRGAGLVVSAYGAEAVPPAALTPGLNARNLHDPGAVSAALQRVFQRLGTKPSRIALLIPDPVAKVSLVRFERVPSKTEDLAQLIRFQVRKSAPFKIEDAQLTYAPGASVPDGGREFVVALARRDIVAEYEAACTAAGAHAGIVDLSSFNVINALLATDAAMGDSLLVHIRPDYSSVAILRGGDLVFFRNRAAEGEGSLIDLVHQTAMYYEDRLGGAGIERVVLTGAHTAARPAPGDSGPVQPDELQRALERRLRTRVEMLDATSIVPMADRITAAPALLDSIAPLVGVMLREHAA